MQILLTAPTTKEIEFFSGCDNNKTDTLESGVGSPFTLYQLQKRIHQIDYDLVIQAGIAGSFTDDLELGSTVIVQRDTFADLGVEEKGSFINIFDMGLSDRNDFPFNNGWLINKHPLLDRTNLEVVTSVTVNKLSDTLLQKKRYIDMYGARIETMEGAALHYVCLQEGIPFIQLRSISNYVGERDKSKWKMEQALMNLRTELSRFMNQLTI